MPRVITPGETAALHERMMQAWTEYDRWRAQMYQVALEDGLQRLSDAARESESLWIHGRDTIERDDETDGLSRVPASPIPAPTTHIAPIRGETGAEMTISEAEAGWMCGYAQAAERFGGISWGEAVEVASEAWADMTRRAGEGEAGQGDRGQDGRQGTDRGRDRDRGAGSSRVVTE